MLLNGQHIGHATKNNGLSFFKRSMAFFLWFGKLKSEGFPSSYNAVKSNAQALFIFIRLATSVILGSE